MCFLQARCGTDRIGGTAPRMQLMLHPEMHSAEISKLMVVVRISRTKDDDVYLEMTKMDLEEKYGHSESGRPHCLCS